MPIWLLQMLLAAFAVTALVVTVLVVGRLAACLLRALRHSEVKLAVYAGLAIGLAVGVLAGTVVFWFGYAVAHSQKTAWTDLRMILITGVPLFGVGFGLWRLAASFQSIMSRRTTAASSDGR